MARATVSLQLALSPDERQVRNDARLDTLTYTLLGEARGEGVEGMVAVANVIRNRTTSGLYSADPAEVALQPWQFSTHNSPQRGGNQAATRREVPPGSELYLQAQEIARRYVLDDGIDITGGSLFYHTTGINWRYAQSATGPYGTHVIGNHVFYPRHPVPQVNIGEAEYLKGYHAPAPLPLPRTARPGAALPVVNVGTIREIERQVAVQRTLAANQQLVANLAAPLGDTTPRNIAPYLDSDGEVQTVTPEMRHAVPPTRTAPVGGLGSLLGQAFPMVPSDLQMIAALPTEPRRNLSAPGAGATAAQLAAIRAVPQSSLRLAAAPDEIDEGALVTRVVRTVKIDPRTGSPIFSTDPAPTPSAPIKLGALPVGHGRPEPPTPAPSVPAVKYPPDRLSPTHNQNDPSEQVASRGRVGEAMRSRQPPVPLPASARPPSLAERVIPLSFPNLDRPKPLQSPPLGHGKPKPLGNPPNVSASLSPPTQTIDPALRNAISAISATPGKVSGVTTQTVRKDGSTVTTPRAGDVQMPITRPAAARPIAQPVGHGAPRKPPAPAAATVKPQPLSPPTQTIDPAMRNAISAVGPMPAKPAAAGPVPPVPAPRLNRPAPAPKPAVPAPAAEPAPPRPAPRRVAPRSVSIAPKPAPLPTFAGSATGTRYTVGGVYLGAGGRYAYQAQASGSFKKIATVDRTAQGKAIAKAQAASPSPTYDASGGNNSFNPTSVRESERWQTGY